MVFLSALFLSGAVKPALLTYDLRFGATPTSPMGPPVPCRVPTPGHEMCPYLEPDYVPNYETDVPQTIRSCGASFVRFEALTDGAERECVAVEGVAGRDALGVGGARGGPVRRCGSALLGHDASCCGTGRRGQLSDGAAGAA